MVETVVPVFLAVSAILIYILQLWTGFAVIGWSGENALIDRRVKPGPYWFVMTFQTLVLVGVPVVIFFAR